MQQYDMHFVQVVSGYVICLSGVTVMYRGNTNWANSKKLHQ